MPTHVALLRGINVGGRNSVPMADLRRIVASLGHTDVATYIQSGNVVFTSAASDTGDLAASMERAIADALGVRPRVVVLSRCELAQVVADNPYPDEHNPKLVHVVFGSAQPTAKTHDAVANAQRVSAAKGSRDAVTVVGRVMYLHTPDGFGRSELAAQLSRIGGAWADGAVGTARNWATVTKLLTICER